MSMKEDIKNLKIAVVVLVAAWAVSNFLIMFLISDVKQECKLEQLK